MKKFFLFAFVVCMCTVGLAQSSEDAVNEHKKLMTEMKSALNNLTNKDFKCPFKNKPEQQQFLLDKSLIKNTLNIDINKPKFTSCNNVFGALRAVAMAPAKKRVNVTTQNFSSENTSFVKNSEDCFFTKSDVHSVISIGNVVSEANYTVTLKQQPKFKGSSKKKVFTGFEVVAIQVAKGSSDSEKKQKKQEEMRRTAERLVREWYKENVPTYFAGKMDGEPLKYEPANADKIVVDLKNPDPASKEATVSNLPTVIIDVNPANYMTEGEEYENNARAYYTFKAKSFKISFSDDFKDGELTVDFEKGTLTKPEPKKVVEDKSQKLNEKVGQFVALFKEVFVGYANNPSNENAQKFKGMFQKNSQIEISVLTNSGVERKTRDVNTYLHNVKGAEIEIEKMGVPQLNVTATPVTATIDFTQGIRRSSYCDHTGKRISLIVNENGELKISGITVVKDATPCE